VKETFDQHVFRILLVATLSIVALGTVVYHITEKFSWLNSYYFSVVTLSTVGYGDYVPHNDIGKIFTTFYIFAGVGIITTFISYSMRRNAERFEKRQAARKERRGSGETQDSK
jgi:ABC-type microcin C transport system permease subunit YejB